MLSELLKGVVFLEEFAIGEERMDLGMTNHMGPIHITSTMGLGNHVMQVDAPALKHLSTTKWTRTKTLAHVVALLSQRFSPTLVDHHKSMGFRQQDEQEG